MVLILCSVLHFDRYIISSQNWLKSMFMPEQAVILMCGVDVYCGRLHGQHAGDGTSDGGFLLMCGIKIMWCDVDIWQPPCNP